MELKELTPKSQIRLLKSIRRRVIENQHNGCYVFLCNHFYFADRYLREYDGNEPDSSDLYFADGWRHRERHFTERVPMFTFDNALEFEAAYCWEDMGGGGWWAFTDYANRLAFLNWLISELEQTQDTFILNAF